MSKLRKSQKPRNAVLFFLIVALVLCMGGITSLAQDKPQRIANAGVQESPQEPTVILSTARTLYVHSRTALVKSEVIESELQKRPEMKQTGLVVIRNAAAADLIMEVRRSNFTTEYPYVVIDARTQVVVASGNVNSLFGTAAAKIAKGFAKQLQKARKS